MIAFLIAAASLSSATQLPLHANIPTHTSGCDTISKPVQLPDASVVWVKAIRDQYGCEIERGQHAYNPRDDKDLQRLKAEQRLDNFWARKAAKDRL